MNTRYCTLVRYDSADEAFVVRHMLENAGIEAHVVDASSDLMETRLGREASTPPMQGGVLLQVPKMQIEEAGEILAERAESAKARIGLRNRLSH